MESTPDLESKLSFAEAQDGALRLPRSFAMQEEVQRNQRARKAKDHGVQVQMEEETISPTRRAMKPSIARLPSRAESFADLDSLSWLNVLLSHAGKFKRKLWHFSEAWTLDLATPCRLQSSLPSFFRNIRFSRFTLGSKSPELGPVQVMHAKDKVDIVLDMQYLSNVDVSIDTGNGVGFGMRHLNCNGKICISLQPIMQQFPITGAAQIFFPFVPEAVSEVSPDKSCRLGLWQLDIEFTGLAALGHFPGIEKTMRDAVKDWLKSHFVLPRSKAVMFSKEVDPIKALSRRPMGVLRAKVLRARNLAGVNCHAFEEGSFTSHPYCILSLGDSSARTSTVRDTTFPDWPVDESGGYFLVHHREQRLQVEVQAEASGSLFSHNFTGFLGSVSCRIGHLRRWSIQDGSGIRCSTLNLNTSQVNRELLHVDDPVSRGVPSTLDLEIQWFDIVEGPALSAQLQAIWVELLKGTGFPMEANVGRGLRWRTWIEENEDHAKVSPKGQTCGSELQFPQVAINPRLFPVIDNLSCRGYLVKDIAEILGINEELVTSYIRAREDFQRSQAELVQAQSKDDYRVDLQWFDIAVHLLDASHLPKKLHIALYDSKDAEVGRLEPISVRSLQDMPTSGTRVCQLQVEADQGIVAWLVPSAPTRFATVQMEICVKLCGLRPGNDIPRM
eukprot:s679_g22.t7